jgi:N-acetylglucosamine kinase-like BadF-type ATPase
MEREAVKKGLSLTTAQTTAAQNEGKAAYANLTDKAKETFNLTEEEVVAVYTRKKLVSIYVNSVAKEMTDSGYEGDDLSTQLNVDGEFYNSSIKTQYSVKVVEKQWEKLPIGTVTIN